MADEKWKALAAELLDRLNKRESAEHARNMIADALAEAAAPKGDVRGYDPTPGGPDAPATLSPAKGDVRGALTALRNRLAMTSDEHWSAEDSRLARNVWLLSPSQDEGEALHEWIVRESERQQLYAATEALRRALEEIANYVPPEDPDKDPYTQIAGFAKRRAREALSRSPEPELSDLEAAGLALRDHLFGKGAYDHGFVGVGVNEIVVYLHASKKRWQGQTPTEWNGFPVRYRFGVGRAIAGMYPGDPEALQDAIELERRGRSE